jgi:hypothetical protein
MLKSSLAIGLFLATAGATVAQVKVELLLEQKQYLLKESLMVGVRVVNHAGQTLNLAGTNWLSLTVEDREKFVVNRIEDVPSPQPLSLESTYRATQWVEIGRAFEFKENSNYTLRARVQIDQWSEEIFSDPVMFEIMKGTKLWEQRFGVPAATGAQPEMRKYILQQANYLNELQLYARVTDDSESFVYKVLRLAPMLLISQPEAQIDTLNRLHVLTQTGMRQFMHVCIDPAGEVVLRNTYAANNGRPQLKESPSGGVYVKGGTRLLRQDDVPGSALLNRPLPARPVPATNPPAAAAPATPETAKPAE